MDVVVASLKVRDFIVDRDRVVAQINECAGSPNRVRGEHDTLIAIILRSTKYSRPKEPERPSASRLPGSALKYAALDAQVSQIVEIAEVSNTSSVSVWQELAMAARTAFAAYGERAILRRDESEALLSIRLGILKSGVSNVGPEVRGLQMQPARRLAVLAYAVWQYIEFRDAGGGEDIPNAAALGNIVLAVGFHRASQIAGSSASDSTPIWSYRRLGQLVGWLKECGTLLVEEGARIGLKIDQTGTGTDSLDDDIQRLVSWLDSVAISSEARADRRKVFAIVRAFESDGILSRFGEQGGLAVLISPRRVLSSVLLPIVLGLSLCHHCGWCAGSDERTVSASAPEYRGELEEEVFDGWGAQGQPSKGEAVIGVDGGKVLPEPRLPPARAEDFRLHVKELTQFSSSAAFDRGLSSLFCVMLPSPHGLKCFVDRRSCENAASLQGGTCLEAPMQLGDSSDLRVICREMTKASGDQLGGVTRRSLTSAAWFRRERPDCYEQVFLCDIQGLGEGWLAFELRPQGNVVMEVPDLESIFGLNGVREGMDRFPTMFAIVSADLVRVSVAVQNCPEDAVVARFVVSSCGRDGCGLAIDYPLGRD